jgi:non-canonical (house-cleaning) NTP pyrophosphatase
LCKDGRVDRMGRMNVYVATRNPVRLWAVRHAFVEWHRGMETNVQAVDPTEHLPVQPLGEEVSRGRSRARRRRWSRTTQIEASASRPV